MIKRLFLYVFVTLVIGVMPTVAQTLSCPFLVEQALLAVGDNCGDLSRNSACYGYNQVSATFQTDVPTDYFSIPADRAQLNELDSLQTAPMNLQESRWGVAVMNIQANLPNTVPGQGVLMLLVGDAEVQNDVSMDDANLMVEPLSTVTRVETTLHEAPSDVSEIIRSVPQNEILLVDGFSTIKNWLRVVNDGILGWVKLEHVARLGAMDILPVVGANRPSPMQAFYLSTGIGEAECEEADSMIAVQSPDNLVVDLTVNGVDIRVGSMITFKQLDPQTMSLTVHRGQVTTIFGNTINAGQSAIGVIGSAPELGNTIVAWGGAVPATPNELRRGARAQNTLNNVAQNNGWDEQEIPEVEEEPETGELIHIVSAGETLYGIGRQYDASLIEIVSRNNLSAPYTLFAGDRLVIPNPGSEFVGLPPREGVPEPPALTEPEPTGTCDTLRLTSPLQSAPAELTPYYWDGVAEATQYRVDVFDSATGALMGSVFTQGNETNALVSAGQFGVGGSMQWRVVALQNGREICRTPLSQPMSHSAPVELPPPVEPEAPFNVSWGCKSYDQLQVDWSGAESNDTVTISVEIFSYETTDTKTGTGSSGSMTFSGYSFGYLNAKTSSGKSDSKSGSIYCE